MEKGFGTIELSTDNNFIIRLKKDHARLASFTIMYTTTITTEGRKQELFENSYDVNYQIFNKERMTEKNSTSVKNLFAEGEADGDLDKQDPNAVSYTHLAVLFLKMLCILPSNLTAGCSLAQKEKITNLALPLAEI